MSIPAHKMPSVQHMLSILLSFGDVDEFLLQPTTAQCEHGWQDAARRFQNGLLSEA